MDHFFVTGESPMIAALALIATTFFAGGDNFVDCEQNCNAVRWVLQLDGHEIDLGIEDLTFEECESARELFATQVPDPLLLECVEEWVSRQEM